MDPPDEIIFKDSFKVGRRREKAIVQYLQSRPDTHAVYNTGIYTDLQLRGIHLVWAQKNSLGGYKCIPVELRAIPGSRYLYIETVASIEGKRQGWLYASRAHYIFFLSLPDDILYIAPLALLRSWFESAKSQWKMRRVGVKDASGYIAYHSEMYNVPVREALEHVPGMETIMNYRTGVSFVIRSLSLRINPMSRFSRMAIWGILIGIATILTAWFAAEFFRGV